MEPAHVQWYIINMQAKKANVSLQRRENEGAGYQIATFLLNSMKGHNRMSTQLVAIGSRKRSVECTDPDWWSDKIEV
jgi:hypothetical protein